jgi:hypothetical protein
MPNRNLNADELNRANELLASIREQLAALAAGDPLLLFAYRRYTAENTDLVHAQCHQARQAAKRYT